MTAVGEFDGMPYALDAVLAGAGVARPETRPVGCSIKWKP